MIQSIEFDSLVLLALVIFLCMVISVTLLKKRLRIKGVLEIIPETNCNVYYLPQAIPRGDCVTCVPDVGYRTPLLPRADHQTAPHALYPTSHREGGSRIYA